MSIKDAFKEQISYYKPITADIADKIEFPVVWSGKRMEIGDKLLYAFVYERETDNLKLITFLERELTEMENIFNYIELTDNYMPVLSFKNDKKIHQPCFQTESP